MKVPESLHAMKGKDKWNQIAFDDNITFMYYLVVVRDSETFNGRM